MSDKAFICIITESIHYHFTTASNMFHPIRILSQKHILNKINMYSAEIS